MGDSINNCGILILAAGQSSRLGSPKQLLEYRGDTLIKRTVQTALDAEIGSVTVVLGANADMIEPELIIPGLHLIRNNDWEEGMASSIRAGVNAIREMDPQTDGIMILVCDQPHLNRSVLQHLFRLQKETGLPIAASVYEGLPGTPALFHKSFFPALLGLKGDTGARKLISAFDAQVAKLPFDQGIVDIDTKEDYQKLVQNK